MHLEFNENYWNQRYTSNTTSWDIGYPSPPIKTFIDSLKNKNQKIIIPGAGNAYEAEYLTLKGFKDVTVVDISEEACKLFAHRFPEFPKEKIICSDYFDHVGKYDLMLEQTFFCAIHPSLRKNYVEKANNLLKPNGILAGLLFQKELYTDHPPFGGSKEVYITLFDPYFEIKIMETAYNSIPPRKNAELFIKMKPK